MQNEIKLAVVVASAGRPEAAAQLLLSMGALEESVECYVSVPAAEDAPRVSPGHAVNVIIGSRGASAQRNAALDKVPLDTDYVFFFDDDALPRQDYLKNMARFMESAPDVIAATGNVIADGAPQAREISHEEASFALSSSYATHVDGDHGIATQQDKLYGCNFVVRWKEAADLRFDEDLPLYSWLEDYDYARRIRRRGRIVALSGSVVVHRGSASGGRQAHLRFGYSQLANPYHLWRKGSFTAYICWREVIRPVTKNVLYSVLPGPQKRWRRRRLAGNVLGLWDILRGASNPGRILALGK